jgi:chemotaxis protein MotB
MKPRIYAARGPARDEEGWLLTYLDLITLLLVFMVVTVAFSRTGEPPDARGQRLGDAQAASPTGAASSAPDLAGWPERTRRQAADPDPASGLKLASLGRDIEVVRERTGVRLRINSEILFDSGQAELAGKGDELIERVVTLLQTAPNHRVVIEGHTDDVPIRSERYPSNWELSTGRAATVARRLIARGIAPARLSATGHADTRPLVSNEDAQGRARNRRVELLIEAPHVNPAR